MKHFFITSNGEEKLFSLLELLTVETDKKYENS